MHNEELTFLGGMLYDAYETIVLQREAGIYNSKPWYINVILTPIAMPLFLMILSLLSKYDCQAVVPLIKRGQAAGAKLFITDRMIMRKAAS